MICEQKNSDGDYTIWNTKTFASADIKKIYEYSLIEKSSIRYRVDKDGITIGSILPLAKAKQLARKSVK